MILAQSSYRPPDRIPLGVFVAMARRSKEVTVNVDESENRSRYDVDNTSLSPGPKENVESTEFSLRAIGGHFRDRSNSYPDDFCISEEEDTAEQPDSVPEDTSTFSHSTPVTRGVSGESSITPTSSVHNHDISLPFLKQVDFQKFLRDRERRKRKYEELSSEHRTTASEDASKTGYLESSRTEGTEQEGEGDGHEERNTTPTPFVPSNESPSLSSEGSIDNAGEEQGPGSPHPFSSYDRYNAKYGKSAVYKVDPHNRG